MLVADIEEPVVAAAARTPFESRPARVRDRGRRRDERPGGQPHAEDARGAARVRAPAAAEPTAARTCWRRSPRAASRCASTRCPPARIAEQLLELALEPERARACAALALGDASLAARLAGEEGDALRGRAEELVRSALAGTTGERPWTGLLEMARAAGTRRRRAGAGAARSGARAAAEQGAQTL